MEWAKSKWQPDEVAIVDPSLTSTENGQLLLTNFQVSAIFFRNDRVLLRIYNRGIFFKKVRISQFMRIEKMLLYRYRQNLFRFQEPPLDLLNLPHCAPFLLPRVLSPDEEP